MTEKLTFAQFMQQKKTESAEKRSTFSKAEFDKLVTKYFNDPAMGHVEVTRPTSKNEAGYTVEVLEPVRDMRKVFHRVLLDYGVDKQEAETMLDGTYEFATMDGAHAAISEILYNYAQMSKFQFLPKHDSDLSFKINDVEAHVRKVREGVPVNGEEVGMFEEQVGATKRISASSKIPQWMRTRLD